MDGMNQAASHPREPGEFKLIWALGASVLVHVVLVLLTYVMPVFQAAEPVDSAEDAVLEFTFAPQTDRTDAPVETARGDVPFETPLAPPPLPNTLPQPTVENSPGERDVTVPREELLAPTEQRPAPPQPEPAPQPPRDRENPADRARTDAAIRDDPSRGVDNPAQQPGTEAPAAADADLAPGAETDPQEATPTPKRTLDIGSALSTFQQSIDRSRAERPPAAQGAPGPKQNVFTPRDMGPLPIQGGPYGILEFSSRDYDWSEYARQIYWEILRAWYNRLYQTAADFEKWAYSNRTWILDHSSSIEFVIERTGNVTGIRLLQPAGCDPLDESALDALSEVILPKLPADFPRNRELVRARFIATGDIRFLRQSLSAGKAAGRF